MVACPLCQAQNPDAATRCARCGTTLGAPDVSEETTTERLNPDFMPPEAVAPLPLSAISSSPLVAPLPASSSLSPSGGPVVAPVVPVSSPSASLPAVAPPPVVASQVVVAPPAVSAPPPPAGAPAIPRASLPNAPSAPARSAGSNPGPGAASRGPRAWWRAATATTGRKRATLGMLSLITLGALTWAVIAIVFHFTSMHRRALRRLPRDSMLVAWIDLEQLRAIPVFQHLRRASRRLDGSSVLVGAGCSDDVIDRSTTLALAVGSSVQRSEFSDYALIAGGSASFDRFVACLGEFDRGFRNLQPTGVLRTRSVYTHPNSAEAALEGQSTLQMAWLRDGAMIAPSTHLAQALTAWDGEGSNAYDNDALRTSASVLGRGRWAFVAIDARALARSAPLASRDIAADGLRWGLWLDTPPFDALTGIGIGFGGGASRVEVDVALVFASSAAASRANDWIDDTLRAGRLTTLSSFVADEVETLRRVRNDDRDHPQAPVLPALQRALGALNGLAMHVRPVREGDVVHLRAALEDASLRAVDEGLSAYLSSRARREAESGSGMSWLTGDSDTANRPIVPPTAADATAGVQGQLDRIDAGVWRVDRIEFIQGSAATEDGGERYRVAARITTTSLQARPALDASIALQYPWLTDLAASVGETRMTRPVDLLFVAATQGWRFDRIRQR